MESDKIPLLQKFHSDFLDGLDLHSARLTGVLFVLNSSTFIQVVEAPTRVLVQLLRALAEASGWAGKTNLPAAAAAGVSISAHAAATAAQAAASSASSSSASGVSSPLLLSSALLSFSEEVPREFHMWAFRSMRLPVDDFASSPLGLQLARDAVPVVFDSVRLMLELGRDLAGMTEEKAIDLVQTSQARALTTRLPTAERIKAYLHSCDELASIREWLNIYDTPIEFTLENEKVWPVEPFLKY